MAVVISIIGCASGLFGIFQFFDLVPKELIAGSPPTALQFNRNFFGSSQILILPFALIGFLSSSGSKRYIHLISISLIVWSITISQTRSAVLSLLIFGLVVLATLAIRYLITNPNRVKSTIFGFSLAVFVAGGGFLGATYFDNVSRDVSRYFKSERADRRQTSIEERLTIWKGSLDMIKSNPIIGVGFGHWRIHYAGNSNQPTRAKSGRAVISKAHNVYLEVLAETGIVGFLFYSMFLLGLSLIILKTGIHDKYGLVLSAGFLAYLSDYFFSFGNYQPSHMAYAGILLAYIIHLSDSETGRLVTRRSVLVVGGLMTFVALIATYWSLTFLFFDQNMSKGQKNSSQGDYETALYYFNNAANSIHLLNRAGDSPHLQKALVYNKMKRFDTAIGELRQAWPDNPYSPRLNATFGTSYFQKKDLEKASYYYQNAFDVQSRNLAIAEKLAICYFDMKRFRKCVEILSSFEKELNPNLKLILQISRMNSGQWAIPKE
ncbi:MAG: O-antigen ligase family protein [Cyclobacteriaceae bacterium]